MGAEEAAVEAYVWGYPLVVMHRTRALLCSRIGSGRMNHRDHLATPADRAVVAPNNDTLYSSGWFDLRFGDLVIDVPPMDHPGRYWNVMILDAYTHVAYACRRLHGVNGTSVRVTLDPSTEPASGTLEVIPVATSTVWVLVRVLVDGPEDLPAARTLQRGIAVSAPPEHPNDLTERRGRPNEVHAAGAGFFEELRSCLAIDPPGAWHPPLSDHARRIADGDHSLSDEQLAAAVAEGDRRLVEFGVGNDATGNGWGTRRSGAKFGHDVLARAAVAKFALAGHHPEENRAYFTSSDGTGAPLDGRRPVVLTFPVDREPPCDGFWSLTVYGQDMYLVDNEIDRWAIGDRTVGLRRDTTGLAITVGGPRPADIANWLPAPAGPYLLALRVYEGRPGVVDASWFPPPLG